LLLTGQHAEHCDEGDGGSAIVQQTLSLDQQAKTALYTRFFKRCNDRYRSVAAINTPKMIALPQFQPNA
jgi:hypothetical protein